MSGSGGMQYSALGPELYSGTCGMALFLSELYAATGEAAARRVALGAVRQALSRVNDLPPLARLGLHTGFSGIALAAARLGVVLGEQELLHRSANLLKSLWLETKTSASLTLSSGALAQSQH